MPEKGYIRVMDKLGRTLEVTQDWQITPDTADYIIFKDGNVIKAKNGRTGEEEFEGGSVSTVMSEVISRLASGGKIYIVKDTYDLKGGAIIISDKDYITIESNGAVIENGDIIFEGTSTYRRFNTLRGLKIKEGTIYVYDQYRFTLEDVEISNTDKAGIVLQNKVKWSEFFSTINVHIDTNTQGIVFKSPVNSGGTSFVGFSIERLGINLNADNAVGILFESGLSIANSKIDTARIWIHGNNCVGMYFKSGAGPDNPLQLRNITFEAFNVSGAVGILYESIDYAPLFSSPPQFSGNTYASFVKIQGNAPYAGDFHGSGYIFRGGVGTDVRLWVGSLKYQTVASNSGAIYIEVGKGTWKSSTLAVDRYYIASRGSLRVVKEKGFEDVQNYDLEIYDDGTKYDVVVHVTGDYPCVWIRSILFEVYTSATKTGYVIYPAEYDITGKTQVSFTLQLVRNSGTATFSGDGTTTTFQIAHGLGSIPTNYFVQPLSSDAQSSTYNVSVDATYITITYTTAPAGGTDNLKFYWYAEV